MGLVNPAGDLYWDELKYNYGMRRNLFLVLAIIVGIILVVNSIKKLLTFRTTTQKVAEAQNRLEALREENKKLKEQLEYTKSEEFREREIRDKLGLVKEGEAIVVLPKENDENSKLETRRSGPAGLQARMGNSTPRPNWQQWWTLF